VATTTQAQINALLASAKPRVTREFTDLHRLAQAGAHLHGIRKTYQRYDEEGEQLPGEVNYPQVVVEDLFPRVATVLGRLFNLQFTQDMTNGQARADIEVDGNVLLPDVPVTYMLFLEKQLTDLRTFIAKLPKLDPAEKWTRNDESGDSWYESEPAATVRTKKNPRQFVKWAPPSPEYKQEAQVEILSEDIPQGTWTTVKLCGAVPGARVVELLDRVDRLIDAVKVARERANAAPAIERDADPVFEYLFSA
jgi:hypothetical protein